MCKDGECLECMTIDRNQLSDYLDKIARFLIDSGSVKTDDMVQEEIPVYVVEAVTALRERVAKADKALTRCITFLTNVNTITDDSQIELVKELIDAGRADLADAVSIGGFGSAL